MAARDDKSAPTPPTGDDTPDDRGDEDLSDLNERIAREAAAETTADKRNPKS